MNKEQIGDDIVIVKWKKRDLLTDIKSIILRNAGVSEEEFFVDDNKKFHIDCLEDAASCIKDSIKAGEDIRIIGDYDADGVNSTAILLMTLQSLKAKVSYRLPKRISEGYGISEKIVDEINSGLIITVDNGISAIDVIQKAKNKGLKVIIIDHHLRHESGEIPNADIVIDPNAIENSADFNGYCGAGLAYKLAEQLIPDNKKLLDKLICFAAIGTIADVMELKSENRRIVQKGLANMTSFGKRTTGLASILSACEMNKHLSSIDVAFKIGPMINAPGRLYDDGAKISVEALIYNGKYDEKIGLNLVRINEERKDCVETSVKKIKENISLNCLYGDIPLIVYEPGLNEGIIGIMAGRLAEELNTPTMVFTDSLEPGLLKGSARTARGIHLKNLLDACSTTIYKYGGHAEAAGITIEKDKFYDFVEMAQDKVICPEESEDHDTIEYDLEIDASEIGDMYNELRKYEPFGNGNPRVVFKINNYKLSPRYSNYYRLMGKDNSHIKLFGVKSSAIWFGEAQKYFDLKEPRQVSMIGEISCNYFRDIPELQVEVKDLKNATIKIEKSALGKRLEELAKKRYEEGEIL